jgi:alanyl-tRNA synthetase
MPRLLHRYHHHQPQNSQQQTHNNRHRICPNGSDRPCRYRLFLERERMLIQPAFQILDKFYCPLIACRGIRRLVAVTGASAKEAQTQSQIIETLAAQGKAAGDAELAGVIAALQKAITAPNVSLLSRRYAQAMIAVFQDRSKKWQKQESVRGPATTGGFDPETLLASAETVNGVAVIIAEIPNANADALRSTWDWLKKKHPQQNVAALLASQVEETDKDGNKLPPKVNLLAAVGDPLIGKLKAGDWIKAVASIVGGSGGGRPQLAMAGGKDVTKIADALGAGSVFARQKLSV